jgi:hypothetical protein
MLTQVTLAIAFWRKLAARERMAAVKKVVERLVETWEGLGYEATNGLLSAAWLYPANDRSRAATSVSKQLCFRPKYAFNESPHSMVEAVFPAHYFIILKCAIHRIDNSGNSGEYISKVFLFTVICMVRHMCLPSCYARSIFRWRGEDAAHLGMSLFLCR